MFQISRNAKWYLYGANDLAVALSKRLKSNGIHLDGILDRYKKDAEFYGTKIINPLNIDEKKDGIVILALQSIITAEQVVEQISHKFLNIIFPVAGKQYNKERADHNRLLYEKIHHSVDFPLGEQLFNIKELRENLDKPAVLRDYGAKVVCSVPIELIYTKPAEMSRYCDDALCKAIKQNSGIWLPLVDDLNALMDYLLDGDESNLDLYAQRYSVMRNRSKEYVIADRLELFQIWEYELAMGGQYFIDSATTANFRDGRFYIDDGAHRAMFLYKCRWKSLPLCISKSDYEKYICHSYRKTGKNAEANK